MSQLVSVATVNVSSVRGNEAAPAVDVELLVAQVISQPLRKRKEADENRGSQAQVTEMLSYPQPTQVLQAPRVS